MQPQDILPWLLGIAVLVPLASFALIFLFGPYLGKGGEAGGYVATGAILTSFVLSALAAIVWLVNFPPQLAQGHHEEHPGQHQHDTAPPRIETPDAPAAQSHLERPRGATPVALVDAPHAAPAHAAPVDPHHPATGRVAPAPGAHDAPHGPADPHAAHHSSSPGTHAHSPPPSIAGEVWLLGRFGDLRIAVSYYIDALTVTMFCMVTLIATCIHFYAQGYMHDELHEIVDHEVPITPRLPGHGDHSLHSHDARDHALHGHGGAEEHQAPRTHQGDEAHTHGEHRGVHPTHDRHDTHGPTTTEVQVHPAGSHVEEHDTHGHSHGHSHDDSGYLHREGRFHRFFQYLSLFCFSMLGLLFAGNIAMVFIFWELVGVCSYFLIGFYVERQSASTAANKAFIVNRVGDFGMLIGLMALWGGVGTFSFGDIDYNTDGQVAATERGLFSTFRPAENHYEFQLPAGIVRWAGGAELASRTQELRSSLLAEGRTSEEAERLVQVFESEHGAAGIGYWLMIVAGIGIFCGCVGKSAQFPLHTWLPDAMEGPTPVSALVHSATMVAAGVYLVSRFYPVFVPEVLLVIAIVGAITLFVAATIAITAVDIKRVLAYSTISQLGYMMLALGLGGWLAGVMHLITHAFFKSLLFLCSGSVIHAVHTNDMSLMGGLRQKMPVTAWTMLIGCLAIAGAGIPFVIGLSGYYSKDAILEQALSFWWNGTGDWNRIGGALFFFTAAGGAAITAFYMFRLWFLTFEGTPRDQERFDHAHDSPAVMYVPLIVLAVFAVCVAWPISKFTFGVIPIDLTTVIESARPAGTAVDWSGLDVSVQITNEHDAHAPLIVRYATIIAFCTALGGVLLAAVFYYWRVADPEEVREAFPGVHRFLVNKWWFDELYDLVFVRPAHFFAHAMSAIDRNIIDAWIVDFSARVVRTFSLAWEFVADQVIVDGIANGIGSTFYALGTTLREVQTGNLRQYVLLIVVSAVALFILISFFWSLAVAG